ncbi:MAG TPA: M15 family metallopeptidase [Candidatus Paceibacterota bacterium]|nr:M15 family metallopeptidase [Candidatus Paceibacterota bacterium]
MKMKRYALFAAIALAVVAAGAAFWYLAEQNAILRSENDAKAVEVATLENAVSSTNSEVATLQITLASTTLALQNEQKINGTFEGQINELSGTVGQLQKVASTDPHLLEKYSKVYFLNENYAPASLSPVDTQYLYNPSHTELVLSGTLPFLDGMLAAAARDGVALQVVSAYRSFYQQASLKLDYKTSYGTTAANQFSADQGYSEHQLGTAIDFGTPNAKNLVTQFASSSAYQWLVANAYRYGYVISYPPGNVYYQYEPWHWRFVGVALATYLHGNGEYFFNLSQDQINQYLGSFFDLQ